MKKTLFLITLLSLCYQALIFSQTLTFIYYDKAAIIATNFTTGVPSTETGFSSVIVTPQNLQKFKTIAPLNILKVYTALNDKTSKLRKSVDKLTQISQKSITLIEFHIVNDKTGLPTTSATIFCRDSDPRFAWPCATNRNNTTGVVYFGENSAASADFESTVIHELSHTQTLKAADGFDSRYGKNRDYVRIAYGGDEGHYLNELQGDQQLPMDEAFGNFWGGVHDPARKMQTILNFNSNQEFLLGSHSNLTGTPEIWNAKHRVLIETLVPPVRAGEQYPTLRVEGYILVLVNPNLQPGQSRYIARLYKNLNVPKDYVYYSEILAELYLHMTHQYAFQSPDTALIKITDFAKYYATPTKFQVHRYPNNMAMFFSSTIEKYNKRQLDNPLTKNEKVVSSIFPLALYDVLMHFGLSDADLKRKFDIATYNIDGVPQILKPKAVDVYLSKRNEIKTLLCPFISGNKDCKDANTQLNINTIVQELKKYCTTPAVLALTK